jgi:predicted metal-binding membrane protein
MGWWWTAVSAAGMRSDAMPMKTMSTTSFTAFLIAWTAMMAAMMLPAVLPVVRRYAHAADGNTTPAVTFVAAYLALWSATGIPAFVAWSRLHEPMAHPYPWVGRLAGAVAVAAGLYQLTPLKATCLRHCGSPIPLWGGNHLDRAARAFLAGGRYGIFCLGSCWMLFVLLIALGTMQLAWMLALSVVIWLERLATIGDRLTLMTAAMLITLGVLLLVHPAFVTHLV